MSSRFQHLRWLARPLTVAAAVSLLAFSANAQDLERALTTLKGVEAPLPDLTGIVTNHGKAIALGKALYWDIQAGSDGQACASCHFRAAADSRTKHQLNPGPNGVFDVGDGTSNYQLEPADFPFATFTDILDRNTLIENKDDRASSQGTFGADFISIVHYFGPAQPGVRPDDVCDRPRDLNAFPAHDFIVGVQGDPFALRARKVEPRNTPTVINAVFNNRNFWDGRANFNFNGVDPFGKRSPGKIVVRDAYGARSLETLQLPRSSVASQAVGPPLSQFEMSCFGRTFPDIGHKLLSKKALKFQDVDPNDSVLRKFRNRHGKGLWLPYIRLVKQSFDKKFWGDETNRWRIDTGSLVPDPSGFRQVELNFSMFWGIAVMLYEATLISDDSKFDRVFDSPSTASFTVAEQLGFDVFTNAEGVNGGNCVNCHDGRLLSKAARLDTEINGEIERMVMGDQDNPRPALYDNGFYNIGVTPTIEDLGVGGVGDFGFPLSLTRQFVNDPGLTMIGVDMFDQGIDDFEVLFDCGGVDGPCDANGIPLNIGGHRVAVDGAFKVPILRNLGLTPPFFHNGGYKNLREVVDFYNHGGNRQGNCEFDVNGVPTEVDTTATDGNGDGVEECNLDPDITNLGLTEDELEGLVAFLLTLTDERVACESGVFDHPSIVISSGHEAFDSDFDGEAEDMLISVPETGVAGLVVCHTNDGDLFVNQ